MTKMYDKRCMTMRRKRRIRLVEDFQPRSIDINELHYARLLGERTVTVRSVKLHHPWLSGLETDRYSIRLKFQPNGEWYGVLLQWRWLSWGAWRPFFLCPFCRKRAIKLYAGSDFVACRKCCGLRYVSQTLGFNAKRHRQAVRIRLRLGGKPVIGAPFPKCPDGMRKDVYARMKARAEQYELPLRLGRYRKYWAWRRPEYPILIRIPRI
jgi:hypothetical protein